MAKRIEESMSQVRFYVTLLGTFAVAALIFLAQTFCTHASNLLAGQEASNPDTRLLKISRQQLFIFALKKNISISLAGIVLGAIVFLISGNTLSKWVIESDSPILFSLALCLLPSLISVISGSLAAAERSFRVLKGKKSYYWLNGKRTAENF